MLDKHQLLTFVWRDSLSGCTNCFPYKALMATLLLCTSPLATVCLHQDPLQFHRWKDLSKWSSRNKWKEESCTWSGHHVYTHKFRRGGYIYIYMYITYLYTLRFVICKPCWFFLISYSCMVASAKKNQTASAATEIRHKKKLQVGKPNDRMLMEFFPQILHSSGCRKLLEDQSILSSTPPGQSISKHPSCFQRWAWGTFDNVWWADGSQA